MKNIFASLFLKAASASIPAEVSAEDVYILKAAMHTLNFGNYSYSVDFQSNTDASDYLWDSLNELIQDSFEGITLWHGFDEPTQIGQNMRIVQASHLNNYRVSAEALAAHIVDYRHGDILKQGSDPSVVDTMMARFNARSRNERIDQVAARIGRWLDRNENWEGYVQAHNDHAFAPLDLQAFEKVSSHHRSYKASVVLGGMIGASPEYQPFRNQSLNGGTAPTTHSP